MLFIAGLMGLFAVGAAAMVDFEDDIDEDARADAESTNHMDEANTEKSDLASYFGNEKVSGISGTPDDDSIVADERTDWIAGYAGDDTITGHQGADNVNGYEGDDAIYSGDGNDWIRGEDGDDLIFGEYGDDTLIGGNNDDTLFGGAGDDDLNGSQGGDNLFGGAGNDTLSGGLNDDTLEGGAGQDQLFGGYGNDTLDGVTGETSPEADFLNGGGGDDTIIAGSGDVVSLGDGEDQVILRSQDGLGQSTTITDFDPNQDRIFLYWDSDTPDDPTLTFESDSAGNGTLRANGEVIAVLNAVESFDPALVAVLRPDTG